MKLTPATLEIMCRDLQERIERLSMLSIGGVPTPPPDNATTAGLIDSLPNDLREAFNEARQLVGWVGCLEENLRSACDPIRIEPAAADRAVIMLEGIQKIYRRCSELVSALANELIAYGDAYSEKGFCAMCAHIGALEYAKSVLITVELLMADASSDPAITISKTQCLPLYFPPKSLRDCWEGVVKSLRMTHQFQGLPSASRLQVALLREAVKVAESRTKLDKADDTMEPITLDQDGVDILELLQSSKLPIPIYRLCEKANMGRDKESRQNKLPEFYFRRGWIS